MTVLGEGPRGAPIGVQFKNGEASQALRQLNDLVEAMEQTPGPPSGIALDGVYGLARVYGEALAHVVRRLGASTGSSGGLVVVHELRPDSGESRALRIIVRLGGSPNNRGGGAELASLECTMPMRRLPQSGRESISVADIVRNAVLAATPELSSVTVVFGAAPNGIIEPAETLARPAAIAARL